MSTPAFLLIQNVVCQSDSKEIVDDAVAAILGKPRLQKSRTVPTRIVTEEIRLWAAYDNGGNVLGSVALLPFQYWSAAKDDELHRSVLDRVLSHRNPEMGFVGLILDVVRAGVGCMQVHTGRMAALMCSSELNRWEPVITRLDGNNEAWPPSWIIQIIQPEMGSFRLDDPNILQRVAPTVRVWDALKPSDDAEIADRLANCQAVVDEMNGRLPETSTPRYRVYQSGPDCGIEYEFTPLVLALAVGDKALPSRTN